MNSTYTGDAIIVRRDSDNATANIGFVGGELNTTYLNEFCTTPVTVYTSDFSTSEQFFELDGTGTINESIGGVSDAYKFELTGGLTINHQARLVALQVNANFTVTFDYYIPSTNTTVNSIRVYSSLGGDIFSDFQTVIDSWTSVNLTFDAPETVLRFFAANGTNTNVDADGDVFYLKNIVVTQNSSNGYVTKWYDQSGNGFDVANTTAVNQPKIYDSTNGIVLENGKPAIQFNGLQALGSTATISNASDYYMFYVKNRTTGNTGYLLDTITGRLVIDSGTYAYFDTTNGVEGIAMSEDYKLFSIELNSTTGGKVYENSINTQTGLNYAQQAISSQTAIGSFYDLTGVFYNGTIQEFIIYNTDQSSNRTGIETNINDFYSIY